MLAVSVKNEKKDCMTDDTLKNEIEKLKTDILSENWEVVKTSADRLGQIGSDEVVHFLISLLALENSGIRDRAALALADIKDDRALEPLLTAIFKKENYNYNGTLVYALEFLNCSQKFKDVFKILFFETDEAKIGAYTILTEQEFDFTEQDLIEIKQMWEDCKCKPEICPGFENKETKDMMQDAVEGFLTYLEE